MKEVQLSNSNVHPEYSDSNINLFTDSEHDVHSIKCTEWLKILSVEDQLVSSKP